MNTWKWIYVGGVLVASIASAIGFTNDILSWVLLLAGLLSGIFFFNSDDLMNFGLRYLILGAVTAASPTFLGITGALCSYFVGFLNGFFNFLGPVLIVMIPIYFWKRYFGKMM